MDQSRVDDASPAGTPSLQVEGNSQKKERETEKSDQNHGPQSEHPERASADNSDGLRDLSNAFRRVAGTIKPSVVQVSVEVRLGVPRRTTSAQLSPEQLQELMRQFGPLLDLNPELRRFYRDRPHEEDSVDVRRYNVPLPIGMASGWVYDADGHIVTNRHVIERADRVGVIFNDKSETGARIVGSDPLTDVAVLKVDHPDLHPARLAEDQVEQGDIVMAVGSPLRYAFSVSQGIVSAKGRQMGILGAQGYENFIQTDAAINPGNSGGPLINIRGEVIGMSTAIASRSGGFAGIGFAIPVKMIREVADEIIQTGRVERGYLGVLISDDKKLLKTFGTDQGVVVEDLLQASPADRAGLQPGDVIILVDDETIQSARQLRQVIAKFDPGQTIRATFLRDGQKQQLEITLDQQPNEEEQTKTEKQSGSSDVPSSVDGNVLAKLGFQRLETLTPRIVERFQLDTQEGVLVVGVRPYSAVAVAGIAKGHIIMKVAGKPVNDIDRLRQLLENHDLSQGVRLRVKIPGGPARFAVLSMGG